MLMELLQHTDCPYFPCSFPEQSCKHCYCMFYPCKIEETGGKYIVTKTGHKLWDCSSCEYIHRQEIVELLNLDINETDGYKLYNAKCKLICKIFEMI